MPLSNDPSKKSWAKKKVIDCTVGREMEVFKQRHINGEKELPISKELLEATMDKQNSQGLWSRASPLGLVLVGSSGSGKTFVFHGSAGNMNP